ncbi:thioesterase family protein [Oceaniserpentilla sp. 4NH20-0058]|uniref:thioesterase family protein n=1 Tax=Oceaniserpentilla sp. 4NH20-0058 TaxID=3127660 RepID=UPI0031024618
MQNFKHYLTCAKKDAPFQIDDSWAQGRSVFGGLSAAMLLTHVEENTEFSDRDLRSINIQFCAALVTEEDVHLDFEILASGKSITHIQAKLRQSGKIKTIINCCFANERPSNILVNPPTITAEDINNAQKFPFIKGIMPNFIQHIDMRMNSKNMPFSGSQPQTIKGWVSFENHEDPLCDSAIIALIDAWPPATLSLLNSPAPSSSVTWNIEFIHPRKKLPCGEMLYYECDLIQAAVGLAHTEARIYSSSGSLLALSRQVVATYDKKNN